MNKLTDNEIIKALECCVNEDFDCEDCPSKKCCDGDTFGMIQAVLDLINRQKAEIERLKSDLTFKTNDYEHLLMKCKEIQAISVSRKDRLMQTVAKLQTAKSEAISEFSARLYAYKTGIFIKGEELMIIPMSDYDGILKEMVGD